MRTVAIGVLAVGLLVSGVGIASAESRDPLSPAATQQLGKLQGTWRALKLKVGGRDVAMPGRSKKQPGVSLEIHGDHYEFHGMGADFKGRVRIDAASEPKRLDLVRDDGQVTLNTYRLDRDSLELSGVPADNANDETTAAAEVWTFHRAER